MDPQTTGQSLSDHIRRIDKGLRETQNGLAETQNGLLGLAESVEETVSDVHRVSGEVTSLEMRLREIENNQ